MAANWRCITVLAVLLVAGCTEKPTEIDPITACVERGVSYFKEIGSYPRLTTAPNRGRLAEEVARERCERTLTAF